MTTNKDNYIFTFRLQCLHSKLKWLTGRIELPFSGGINSLSVCLPSKRTSTCCKHHISYHIISSEFAMAPPIRSSEAPYVNISTRCHAVLCRPQTTPLPSPSLLSNCHVPIRPIVFFIPDQPLSLLLIRTLLSKKLPVKYHYTAKVIP